MPRHFLFLQGPHGPFFRLLAGALKEAGMRVSRIGVNAGDQWSWGKAGPYHAFQDPPDCWQDQLQEIVSSKDVSDIVLYGDARPLHVAAQAVAQANDLTLHVFEEGYLRPHWITYERGGVNGGSQITRFSLSEIMTLLPPEDAPLPNVPDQWGATLRHAYAGALYHAHVAVGRWRYPNYQPHRGLGVWREFALNLTKLLTLPAVSLRRSLSSMGLLRSGVPFHLVLLQLGHDSSVQAHSHFDDMEGFIRTVTEAFAQGAPRHHHLVFKTHPFDDNREPIRKIVSREAARNGISFKTHVIPGGPLAALLSAAQTAVTVNSTAAQQALWRGLPVKALGRSVYTRPELVSDQDLDDFFASPQAPDHQAYLAFRRFLLFTSQIKGSFYTQRGRADILREAVDMMLSPHGPYQRLRKKD